MNPIRPLLLASAMLATAGLVSTALAADTKKPAAAKPATSVVLVHGAFADGSSWNKIIPLLQAKGLTVVAVQNPLSSLGDDVAFTKRVIDAQPGPVVLVGHSWGGTVITQAGNDPKVKALVYVAAFAPSVGETSVDGTKAFPPSPGLAAPIADPQGFLTLSHDAVAKHFAQDLPAAESNLIASTQGAVKGAAFEEKVTAAAWTTRKSWYIVASEDHMIDPGAEAALAKKIKARTTTLATSHVPMLSKPQEVADVILAAAKSIK
jgi:pimeloyl-ACP methyl ester carboxylesterase